MKKMIIYGAIGLVITIIGFGLFRGVQTLRRKYTPQERLIAKLNSIAAARRNSGFLGRHALVVSLPVSSQLILIGGVHGNSMSLQNILAELAKKNLLVGDFTLAPNTYLVFNGNCLDLTPFNDEVLTSIAQLMHTNPQRVWYLRGPREESDTLPLNLTSLFGQSLTDDQLQQIRKFYGTLPLGIYLFAEDFTEYPVRISPYGSDTGEFERIACKPIDKAPLQAICYLEELCSYPEGPLTGIIDSDDRGINWPTMKGIQRSGTAWHLISSPGVDYIQRYDYTISAYAVILMGSTLKESMLTLHYRQPNAESFIQSEPYHLN